MSMGIAIKECGGGRYRLERGGLWIEVVFEKGIPVILGIGEAALGEHAFGGVLPTGVEDWTGWIQASAGAGQWHTAQDGGRAWIRWERADGAHSCIIEMLPDAGSVGIWLEVEGAGLGGACAQAGAEVVGIATAVGPVEAERSNRAAVSGRGLLAYVAIDAIHLRLTGVHLRDGTDIAERLVETTVYAPGRLGVRGFVGNLLELRALDSGAGLLLVREAPTPTGDFTRIHAEDYRYGDQQGVAVYGTGLERAVGAGATAMRSYGLRLYVGAGETVRGALRGALRQRLQPTVLERPLCLSNTWGDRNQDGALTEAFVLKEIAAAAQMGLGGVMLDDGWQQGVTVNSALAKGGIWEGYHAAAEPFWAVNREKFPRGLEPVIAAARAAGIEIGLWFSPDSTEDFRNWERDVDVLMGLYRQYGVRSFKLDGIKLRSRIGEGRLQALLRRLCEQSGGEIVPIMDITAETRPGYLQGVEHGILFLENRYTDWGNYYPYRTLRAVWQLSEWLPVQRMHIEFLNPGRNVERYGDDPFAPCRYPLSYLYALCLVGHPLAWMEVQNLGESERVGLRPLVEWHRARQAQVQRAAIRPIGEEPDGRRWSGFEISYEDGVVGYLVFRDVTAVAEMEVGAVAAGRAVVQVQGSVAAQLEVSAGRLRVGLGAERAWGYLEVR